MIELMTVEDDGLGSMVRSYEQMIDVFEQNGLPPALAFGLLVRMTLQIAGDMPREKLLAVIAEAYDLHLLINSKTGKAH